MYSSRGNIGNLPGKFICKEEPALESSKKSCDFLFLHAMSRESITFHLSLFTFYLLPVITYNPASDIILLWEHSDENFSF